MESGINYFVQNPKMLYKSSGKFIKNLYGKGLFLNKTAQYVNECKDKARAILSNTSNVEANNYISELEKEVVSLVEKIENDKQEGVTTYKFVASKSLEPHELDELVHVDNVNYKRCQTWHKYNPNTKQWSYSISVMPVKQEVKDLLVFTKNFTDFLQTYKPTITLQKVPRTSFLKQNSILIFPKQDAHFNKLDIYGNNDINERFTKIEQKTVEILTEASIFNNLEEIIYIVGSDQFNSEWTSLTTKGTPQQNILSYQDAFKAICNHEITIIENLRQTTSKLTVLFVPGNHDEYVGWHLVNYLQGFYKDDASIVFEDSTINTKFQRYSNSALMFNHGDAIKPKDLAVNFPIQFKSEWSMCDNFYIFTGDKHTEKSVDFNGINFYQVPQLSRATGKWDNKMGFEARPEMQAFLIKESEGMTNIYKRKL